MEKDTSFSTVMGTFNSKSGEQLLAGYLLALNVKWKIDYAGALT